MISKVSPPTFTVVAIADPPMGAAGGIHRVHLCLPCLLSLVLQGLALV